MDSDRALASLHPGLEGIAGRPSRAQAEAGIRTLLAFLGENPDRDGLLDTPARVVKAFVELTEGLGEDPGAHLRTNFDLEENTVFEGMIVSSGIPFVSLCEHHLMPFEGLAHVAYLPAPGGHVVGLSKLARVVEGFARRLQVQERMTAQIRDALEMRLTPRGVAVLIVSRHACQCHRGVKKDGRMVTSTYTGMFLEKTVRDEFLHAIQL